MWSVSTNRHSPESPYTFDDLLKAQERAIASGRPTLIFAELPPTITLGNRQDPARFEPLRRARLTVVPGHRGGLETWHGPGQWVGFVVCPIESLTGDSRGVRKAVHSILERVLLVAREWVLEARIEEGERLGIWSPHGKLASIGIRVRQGWVTSGFSLNVIETAESFAHIDPCGLSGEKPDFLFRGRLNGAPAAREFENLPAKLASAFNKN